MNSAVVLMPTGNGGSNWRRKPGRAAAAISSVAEASTCRPRGPYSFCALESTPITFWQWEQYVRMKATTTILPLYWPMRTGLPWPTLMAKSGEGRGSRAACADGIAMASSVRAAIVRKKRIDSVYRSRQTFHAGDHGAFAAQLETAIVARAGDGVFGLRDDSHLFPFLRELPAIGGEILAGGVNAVPFRGVEQHQASCFLILQQVEGAAAPVRRELGGALFARILFQHDSVLQFAERSAHQALVASGKVGLRQRRRGGFNVVEVFLRVENLLGGNRGLAENLFESFLAVADEDRILEEHALGIREDQGQPEVKRRVIEDRILPRRAFGRAAHHGQQRGRILERLPHLLRQQFAHQPGGLAFHDGEAGVGSVIALAARLDEPGEIVVLVGDGMGHLVGEYGFLSLRGSGVGDEQLLSVVVVERKNGVMGKRGEL